MKSIHGNIIYFANAQCRLCPNVKVLSKLFLSADSSALCNQAFYYVGVIVFLRRRRTKKYIVSGWSITNFVRIISNDYIDLVTHPLLSFRRRTWLLTNSIASKCLVAKLYHCFPWGILHRVSHSGNQTFSHRYE